MNKKTSLGGGVRPVKFKDSRFYDFHRTFQTKFGANLDLTKEFSFDTLKVFPDQRQDGSPNGCTSYTVNEIASNEDGIYFNDQRFTYNNTKLIEGVFGEVPCGLEDAFKSGTAYGVKTLLEGAQEALNHRRAPYYIIKKLNGSYYDGLVSAMLIRQGCVGVGTPWLPWFESVGQDGVIPPLYIDPKMSFSDGHAWSISGQKIINGEPRLVAKSWQNTNFGNGGYCYFNRQQIDSLLSVRGSIALGQKHASPQDIERVQMSILEVALSLIMQFLNKIKPTDVLRVPTPKIIPPEPVLTQPEPVKEPKIDMITKWAKIIAELEGGLPEFNNPGNFKYSALMSSFGGKMAKKASDGGYFCTFPDYQTGFNALCSFLKLGCQNQLIGYHNARTIKEFTLVYTNHPKPAFDYSDTLIKKLGVKPDTDISTFI